MVGQFQERQAAGNGGEVYLGDAFERLKKFRERKPPHRQIRAVPEYSNELVHALRRATTRELLFIRGGILRHIGKGFVVPTGPHTQIIFEDAPALFNLIKKAESLGHEYGPLHGWQAIAFLVYTQLRETRIKAYKSAVDGTISLEDVVISNAGSSIEKALVAQWCFEQQKMNAWFVLGEVFRNGSWERLGYSLLWDRQYMYVLDHEHPQATHPRWVPFCAPVAYLGDAVLGAGFRKYRVIRMPSVNIKSEE